MNRLQSWRVPRAHHYFETSNTGLSIVKCDTKVKLSANLRDRQANTDGQCSAWGYADRDDVRNVRLYKVPMDYTRFSKL